MRSAAGSNSDKKAETPLLEHVACRQDPWNTSWDKWEEMANKKKLHT